MQSIFYSLRRRRSTLFLTGTSTPCKYPATLKGLCEFSGILYFVVYLFSFFSSYSFLFLFLFFFFCCLCRFLTSQDKQFAGPTDHSVLYNAMIHPFLNMTIFGAIWYQGESNSNAPNTYNCTFPAMIDDWRQKWFLGSDGNTNKTFPFGFVQVVTTFLMFVGIQDVENVLYILFWRKNPDLLFCRSRWLFPWFTPIITGSSSPSPLASRIS